LINYMCQWLFQTAGLIGATVTSDCDVVCNNKSALSPYSDQ